jgi:cyclic pyranopterin phosphate synthase
MREAYAWRVEGLTHLDEHGTARMVDVTAKAPSERWARARAVVRMTPETAARVRDGDLPKGDVASVARLAAIQAAKRTAELIPLCHQLPLTHVDCEVEIDPGSGTVTLVTQARTKAETGVEMEALTAASVGALAVYDMVKGVERGVVVERVELLDKTGGKQDWHR